MADKRVVDYIEKHLEKGIRLRKIKNELAKAGHSVSSIEEAVNAVHAGKPHLKLTKPFSSFMYVAVVAIILIIGSAIIAGLFTQRAEFEEVKDAVERDEMLEATADIDLIKMARANDDLSYCEYIDDHNFRFGCLGKMWVDQLCLYLEMIGGDFGQCYYEKALEENDPEICYFSDVSSCFYDLAKKNSDAVFCDANFDCAVQMAIDLKRPEFCELTFPSNRCFDHLAQALNDHSLCENGTSTCDFYFLTTLEQKKEFFNQFSKQDFESYDDLRWSEYDKEIIYFATKSGDAEICDYIQDLFLQTLCVYRTSVFNEQNLCSRLEDPAVCETAFSGDCSGTAEKICNIEVI